MRNGVVASAQAERARTIMPVSRDFRTFRPKYTVKQSD